MSVLKVAQMGHPVLRKKAAPIPEKAITEPEIQLLIRNMVETMVEYDGLGLAAPQVHESVQLVVLFGNFDGTQPKSDELLCLINPKITPLTEEESAYWEGCLSLPGIRGKVSRPNRIRLEALGPDGSPIDREISGFGATVIQHECDHLDGVLYIDRITDKSCLAFEREYLKYHVER